MITKAQSFKEYLAEIESPDYPWVFKCLPENATLLDKAKYALCDEILTYQEDNNLSDETIAQRIELSKEITLQILLHWIDKFTLDELINYTDKLYSPSQIQFTVSQNEPFYQVHVK